VRRASLILTAGVVAALLGACERKPFKEALVLGGTRIPAATLNRGHRVFAQSCAACHGDRGDGLGTAAAGTFPPPRNFVPGFFKFVSVADSGLPTDEDLLRSVTRGVPGTRMPPWTGLRPGDHEAAIHYVKTFGERWRRLKVGPPIARPADPWPAATGPATVPTAATTRGDEVYHGAAQCWTCHPAYRTRDEALAAARRALIAKQGSAPAQLKMRGRLHRPEVVDTRYGRLTPPDFLEQAMHGGDDDADLFRAIAAGIGGTSMPTWAARLDARDLWALVHYVRSLLRMKGTPEARALAARVREAS